MNLTLGGCYKGGNASTLNDFMYNLSMKDLEGKREIDLKTAKVLGMNTTTPLGIRLYLFLYESMCSFIIISLFNYLLLSFSLFLSLSLSLSLSIYPSITLSVSLSLSLSIYIYIYIYISLSL